MGHAGLHTDRSAASPTRFGVGIRDAHLKGFGLRVLPSGSKRYFIHSQHRGRRIWNTVGKSEVVTVEAARARSAALLAAIRRGEEAPALPEETVFETVAEDVFRHYGRNWKPRTVMVNRNYYKNQILPWFRGRRIAGITQRDVQAWFASPGSPRHGSRSGASGDRYPVVSPPN